MGEDLPDRGEGETERDLILADRSKRPRLTTHEQTLLANCARPMELSEWGETTPDRQRGTLELMRMAYWKKETTTERGKEKVGANQVSPNPPPPKAPAAYWGIQKWRKVPRMEKGRIPNEIILKERTPKGAIATERIPKGKIPTKGRRRKRFQRREELPEGRRRSRGCAE